MLLKDYLKKEKMSVARLSRSIGCGYHTLLNYMWETRNPSPEIARLIVEFTKGEVTYEDLQIVKKTKCKCPTCGRLYTVKEKK